MRAKAKLFQQAGGGLKKQCKKLEPHNNIKTSKLFCPFSYSSLSFAVWNRLTVTPCNMYLTCLM